MFSSFLYFLSIRTSSYLLFLIAEKKYFLISKKKAGEPYGAILAFSFQVYKAVCLAAALFHNAIKYGSLLVVKWPLRPPQRPPCAWAKNHCPQKLSSVVFHYYHILSPYLRMGLHHHRIHTAPLRNLVALHQATVHHILRSQWKLREFPARQQ